MKKLLLIFFMMLSFNFISQAIPLEYCYGTYVPEGQCTRYDDTTYYGAVAINKHTRKWSGAWNYTDPKKAEKSVLESCGNDCILVWGTSAYHAIAISEDDENWGYGSANDYNTAKDKAITMCQKSGKLCYVAVVGYPTKRPLSIDWGGVAYNPQTGLVGKSSNSLRKYEAENAVLKNAGCNDKTRCYFYVFQDWYGALAKSESGNIYIGSSNKSKRDAEKQAEKNCKNKKNGEKNCKALVSSERDNKK